MTVHKFVRYRELLKNGGETVPEVKAAVEAALVALVAEEEMETEEDEADSKRRHVVHSMNGVACISCRLRRFFFIKNTLDELVSRI